MLRKALLVVLAVFMSFGLTAFSGYLAYANSNCTSEAKLSLVVRFAISPIIAILIGALVGFLSNDHPVLLAVLGLLPWTVMFLVSPQSLTSLSAWAGWLSPVVIYLLLSATAARMAWRYRGEDTRQPSQLA
jgi:hypothetical protein